MKLIYRQWQKGFKRLKVLLKLALTGQPSSNTDLYMIRAQTRGFSSKRQPIEPCDLSHQNTVSRFSFI